MGELLELLERLAPDEKAPARRGPRRSARDAGQVAPGAENGPPRLALGYRDQSMRALSDVSVRQRSCRWTGPIWPLGRRHRRAAFRQLVALHGHEGLGHHGVDEERLPLSTSPRRSSRWPPPRVQARPSCRAAGTLRRIPPARPAVAGGRAIAVGVAALPATGGPPRWSPAALSLRVRNPGRAAGRLRGGAQQPDAQPVQLPQRAGCAPGRLHLAAHAVGYHAHDERQRRGR